MLFLLFIWGVSLFADIRRVYEYHGAEHKTVFAFENGDPLTTAAVQKYSTYHPALRNQLPDDCDADLDRLYMLIPFTTFWARFAARIALLPVIAGVSYEIIRFAAKHADPVRPDDRARPLAAAHHHQAAVRRTGAVRHRRARPRHGAGKRAWRRTGDCLAAPAANKFSLFSSRDH